MDVIGIDNLIGKKGEVPKDSTLTSDALIIIPAAGAEDDTYNSRPETPLVSGLTVK